MTTELVRKGAKMAKEQINEAVIMLFLSTYRPSKEEDYYIYSPDNTEAKSYRGSQTNDAPLQYLCDSAIRDGKSVTKILCITTRDNTEVKDDIGETTYDHFCSFVRGKIPGCEVVPIRYDYTREGDKIISLEVGTNTQINELYRQLSGRLTGGGQRPDVYIDYTGGLRDTSLLMMIVLRYLEFIGCKCRKVVYSQLKNHTIYNINYIYGLFGIISAVNDFLSTGNASQLEHAMSRESKTRRVIHALMDFSDDISICKVSSLDNRIDEITVSLNEFEQVFQKAGTGELKLEDHMFYSLIPEIRSRMHMECGRITYPDLINWCLDNRMVQQALTIYIEKMPTYYRNLHIITEKISDAATMPGQSGDTAWFYTGLFEYCSQTDADRKALQFVEDVTEAAKDSISNLKNKAYTKERFLKTINKQKKKDADRARYADELKSIVNTVYDDGGNRRAELKIAGMDINQGSLESFIKVLDGHKIHMARHMSGSRHEEDAKIDAIKNVKNNGVILEHIENDSLYKIMLYYEAAKVVRNQINHATGADESGKDNSHKLEFLQENGIDASWELEPVTGLLRDGVRISQEIEMMYR